MKKKTKGTLYCTLLCLTAFALFTVATCLFDVKAIGPEGSKVGFATVNGFFHDLTGVHLWLYDLTDLLSVLPLSAVLGFALLGLSQWIKRKSLLKVDADVLVLGGFYLSVLAVFLLFEKLSPNFRPVLLDGTLEPSYPSSTTMLVLCVLSTFALQMRTRIKNRPLCSVVLWSSALFAAFMVIGRLLSGVHWLTDILGGVLCSVGLVLLYCFFCRLFKKRNE
jgi:undecaprenyl-diphosphatase